MVSGSCNGLTRRAAMKRGAFYSVAVGISSLAMPRERGHADELDHGLSPTPWPVSLNTSTIRGHRLPISETIRLAARTGYRGIEPWPNEIEEFVQAGGSLSDLKKMLDDNGMQVTGAIAFFDWMSDDADRRARGLEDAARLMDQLAVLGATHIAAPPRGGTESTDLLRAAENYRTLLELGDRTGVTPALEIWGFAPVCSRLGEAALIAIEAQHPKACILPDVYHLYKGGSGLGGVPKIGASILGGFHINDYSAQISPAEINDRDRVFPGDGDAPLVQLFRDLHTIQYAGPVSVELFNPEYYARPAEEVMATALSKTLGLIRDALNG